MVVGPGPGHGRRAVNVRGGFTIGLRRDVRVPESDSQFAASSSSKSESGETASLPGC